ncbi:MAG: hypothetical protein IPN70_01170 [Candidatus Moraniibacteriota bacterium]|nr:MAG: hypothetical protein IPN70_01170 [Candidatus Moranbacteria bacterium]
MNRIASLPQRIYRHLLLLQAHDEFMSDVIKLREKGGKLIKIIEEEEDGDFPLYYEETQDFDKEVRELRNVYGLSEVYHFLFKSFVKWGRVHEILTKESIVRVETIPSDEEMREYIPFDQKIAIEIFPETMLKDIVNNWKKISQERDRLYKIKKRKMERFSQRDNLERDLAILQFRKEGKSAKEIVRLIAKNTSFKNRIIGYEEVPKIIKRLKQRAKDSLPSKET